MNKILKKGTYFIFLLLITACGTSKDFDNTKLNTYPNSQYKKSRSAYSGTLNKKDYNELIKKLEVALKTNIPAGKSILINYNQKAPNCISVGFGKKENEQIIQKRINISSRISTNHHAVDFFVYTNDSYYKEIYKQLTNFTLDTGFFYENIFRDHQNCAGFFIIKPNGKFYKQYGEDYFSQVETFFK